MLSVYFALCSSHGLTFTWWGCYGLCLWHKLTELAHSFFFCSCVYFCLYGPFNCISSYKSPRRLSVFSLCSFGLVSALLVLSTKHLFMKVSFSPGITSSGWLGSKHQLPNQPIIDCCIPLVTETGLDNHHAVCLRLLYTTGYRAFSRNHSASCLLLRLLHTTISAELVEAASTIFSLRSSFACHWLQSLFRTPSSCLPPSSSTAFHWLQSLFQTSCTLSPSSTIAYHYVRSLFKLHPWPSHLTRLLQFCPSEAETARGHVGRGWSVGRLRQTLELSFIKILNYCLFIFIWRLALSWWMRTLWVPVVGRWFYISWTSLNRTVSV